MKHDAKAIRILRQVRDLILKNPDHLDMDHWLHNALTDSACTKAKPKLSGNCNTTGCIAGWVVATDPSVRDVRPIVNSGLVQRTAEGRLGLEVCQANRLFFVEEWPLHLRMAYSSAVTDRQRAAVTADRIDLFIEELQQ